jgi:hypothetical protein
MTETSHCYRVGEQVVFHPSLIESRELAGTYSVERLLPSSGADEVPTYRVKSLKDGHERTVAEVDIAPI